MWNFLAVALSLILSAEGRVQASFAHPPIWPSAYEVSYTLELPFVASVQPGGLKYPVTVVYDGPANSAKMGFYEDLDVTYFLPGLMYDIYPRIDKQVCEVVNTTTGPTAPSLGDDTKVLPPPLPDLNAWEYGGEAHLHNKKPSVIWQLTQRNWEKVNTYSFHVSKKTGDPIMLNMIGVNLMTGSHFDQYEVTFTHFKPLSHSGKNTFKPPELCGKSAIPPQDTHHARKLQHLSLLPSSLVPGAATTSSSGSSGSASELSNGRTSSHSMQADADSGSEEFTQAWWRRMAWMAAGLTGRSSSEQARVQSDLDFISNWNAKAHHLSSQARSMGAAQQPSFKLSPNKFLSMPDEQWRAVALGRRPEQAKAVSKAQKLLHAADHLPPFKRVLSDEQLPKSVDYRGTGADGPVKDQASCGSCWAFATAGAMTGAWYMATGSSLSLSEQQLVDCSWDSGEYGNKGCGGGWTESALSYAASAGVASESDYKYLGQNGYCMENQTAKVAKFKGFMSVPYKDEKAMMEAVATHGPIAISYDAGHITMKYYSEGVYSREDCGNDAEHLDHAVTLVGYGTTTDGVDYWLLRNSWSVLWGESGYFKVVRKGNDCGITVNGVVAVVDPKAVSGAKRDDAQELRAAAQLAATLAPQLVVE